MKDKFKALEAIAAILLLLLSLYCFATGNKLDAIFYLVFAGISRPSNY